MGLPVGIARGIASASIVMVFAGNLLLWSAPEPQAATITVTEPSSPRLASAPSAPVDALSAWRPSPESLAQGAGALVGIATYSLLLAPEMSAGSGVARLLSDRFMATILAATGAVAATYVYDRWTGEPIDYSYFWHRGGFVLGMAAGVATFGVLGYPVGTDATWVGWTANRAALIGAGLAGAWAMDRWHDARTE
jgi:hypothetical protein